MIKHTDVLLPSPQCRFYVEYTRTIPEPSYEDGLTLLLFHAVNLHKEALDVMISDLLRRCNTEHPPLRIRDVWAVDNPNHGRSAVLNRELLDRPEERSKATWTSQEHADAAMALLCSRSTGVDFRKRKLVGVGQCGGATSLILLTKMKPSFPIHGVIFLDPSIFDWRNPSTDALATLFQQFALRKRDTWPSRAAAYEDLKKRYARTWHPEVLLSFVENALRPVGDSPDAVTLSCTREQEALYFKNWTPTVITILDVLTQLVHEERIPLYLLITERDEYDNALKTSEMKALQSHIIRKSRIGFVHLLPKGGHLFPLTEPGMAADYLRRVLLEVQDRISRTRHYEQDVARARL